LLLMLGGCATPPSPVHKATPDAQANANWTGRLSLTVRSADPAQNKSFSASFELSGSVQQGSWLLLSPLGSTLARLNWDRESAVLWSPERGSEPQNFESIDDLMAHTHVAGLPFAALLDWMQGIPTPVPGWQIDLSQFANGKLRAQRQNTDPAIDLRVVLDR
jgi:outer membrane lipoprotein LolB